HVPASRALLGQLLQSAPDAAESSVPRATAEPIAVPAADATPSYDGISIRNLSAWYGARQAIREISLDVPNHQVTAIIGPSGCGKSTLIRCLNRMHEV